MVSTVSGRCKKTLEKQVLVEATKQSRKAVKAGKLARQTGLQGRQAYKADRLSRQTNLQGRQAYKADRLTRQTNLQG
jgi:hypothetical protein